MTVNELRALVDDQIAQGHGDLQVNMAPVTPNMQYDITSIDEHHFNDCADEPGLVLLLV